MDLRPGRAPPSLTSPGTSARWCKYKVFLSFRGEDTRMGFVSHLFNELERQGISTFKDDRELEGGAPISTEIESAIQDSYLAIVVLSPNYASSSWCLNELTKIVQCKDSILPIFYGVDPSLVRHQRGSFAEAFEAHERKLTITEGREKMEEWRAALKSVAGLSGWHLDKNKCEREIIEAIVKCVWRKVQSTFQLFDSLEKFVERDSTLNHLSELLDLSANDVRFIGITGMAGIGKTTLAHRVCDIISHHFDIHCFLENVREDSAKDSTLIGLQNQLLFSIFKEKGVEFWDARRRVISTREGLRNKKVLLVLDDVDHLDQLQKLAGEKDWFGNGSRIIFTTRDRRLLVQHDITFAYEVEGMSDGEALAVFSLKAFKKVQPDEEFLELSEHFVNHAKGVPLVLKVWGSCVYKRDRDGWNSVLDNLQSYPHRDVFDSLKISYDGLQEEEKGIFLDIACFHKGKNKEQIIDILDRRFGNISSMNVIDTLIERSLLTLSHHIYLEMHDLIQEMGWEVVDRESKVEPGKRTRIWRLDDLRYVLMTNTGTEKVEAVVVNSPKLEEIRCNSNCFSNMHGLRHIELHNVKIISSAAICLQHFLRIIHWSWYPWALICLQNFLSTIHWSWYPSAPIGLPHFLRIIDWSWYPSKFLPQSFHARYLTELSMPKSKLVRLWDGSKDFPNLKKMDLAGSDKFTTTPDFTGVPNLEDLHLSGCRNLVEIHPSIAVLKRLKVLNFGGCKSIKSLPDFSEKMKTLSRLDLDWTSIKQLPSSVGNLIGLTSLTMRGSKVVQLWNGRKDFPNLKYMALTYCDNLISLPDFTGIPNLEKLECWKCTNLGHIDPSIAVLKRLKNLILSGCLKMKKFLEYPEQIETLSELDLDGTAIDRLPSSIGNLVGLTSLNVNNCNLGEGAIPENIGCLSSLTTLYLGGNHFVNLPASIQYLSKLKYLGLARCKRLRELPPLPPSRHSLFSLLYVNIENCTSLQRLTDPSKLSSKFANLYDFNCFPLNCMRLVEDEGWVNYLLSKIVRWITEDKGFMRGARGETYLVYPGSEIPEWFIDKSEEAGDWLGIAFCVVLTQNRAANCHDEFSVRFKSSSRYWTMHYVSLKGQLGPEHVTMFYRSREKYPEECPEAAEGEFSFQTTYYDAASRSRKVGVNMVKKWAARWVYKQDLEDLQQRLTPTETENPQKNKSDDEEPNRKRQKEAQRRSILNQNST